MLKITLHDGAKELRFKLEGKLSGPWIGELRQCWHTAQSTTRDRRTVLDLAELDFVDAEGQALLQEMHAGGVTLVAMSPFIRAIVDEVCHRRQCARVEEKPPHGISSSAPAGSGPGTV